MRLERTGTMVPFLEISIGQPFWAHDKIWIRTDYEAATELVSTDILHEGKRTWGSVCNFLIDEGDKFIEAVRYVIDPAPHKPCGHTEPESDYRDPETGAHRTAKCEGTCGLVIRGNGIDSTTDGTIFIGARPCPNAGAS